MFYTELCDEYQLSVRTCYPHSKQCIIQAESVLEIAGEHRLYQNYNQLYMGIQRTLIFKNKRKRTM